MSNFPTVLDDDNSIYRIDDNLSELGVFTINQLRSAVFAIEGYLGLTGPGSLSSMSSRLDVSLNPDGTIKASALTSVGLATLPIVNSQVGTNAGILESKLHLDYGTSDLHTLIQANSTLLNSLSVFEAALEVKVNSHIAGGPASNLRHVASHIDINAHPTDSRDGSFTWGGLIDKDGYQLTATNVAGALDQINTTLTGHQNQVLDAHPASAISVDTSNFSELLATSENVQQVLENIDDIELLQLGTHRATQHSNGIPKAARSLNLSSATTLGSDGYNLEVVSSTPCQTFVAHNPPGIAPIDNVSVGDSIITFKPATNVGSVFDAKFSQVKVGDIIRINYGSIEDIRRVESIRFTPGSEWVIRINGVNLIDTDGYTALARIDRPLYDSNTSGVLAVAAANPVPLASFAILGSVIIGDPRGATALGMNFDVNKFTSKNYNLYLELYPTGNPADHVIKLPAVDVTGNAGATPGLYTLDDIVTATNNAFRATGYNFRFIAYSVNGNFGIMLADSIDGASFAIINGSNATGSLTNGTYVHNVIGDADGLHIDPLGFGFENANLASPTYQASWLDATAAQIPTKIIHPVKSRNYIVNGRPFDNFKQKDLTTNGFWVADIDSKNITGISVEVTYKVNTVLDTAGLKPGKTIIVQPAVGYSDPLYKDVDYGRFIIKSVVFNNCHCVNDYTLITVINGVHGTSNPLSITSNTGLPVRLYFGEDSVGFDDQNIIDQSDTSINYHRFHEIYISDQKTTFSHERARMAYTTETSNLLDTSNWHILSVSPKFRGYKDTSGSLLNKYIRLLITNYNSQSGEFDGYLGERDNVTNHIFNTGRLIRGKKNVPVKFYDDTDLDYIEFVFKDESTSLPTTVIPTNKWLDIEIFPSLLLDQELLPLASCEVNWTPLAGRNIISYVKNLKQYGSISELEFTQSAVNFITSGDRFLHGNGILSGFDADIALGSNKVLVHGGTALVNGKIVTSNSSFINIPLTLTSQEYGDGGGNMDWIVCIDEYGGIKYYPLVESKRELLVIDPDAGVSYIITSYTFPELISNKSVTPLYIVNVTVTVVVGNSTIVYNSCSDARKFVKNETNLIPLTWVGKEINDSDVSSTTELNGHFNTINQIITWINWTKSPSNLIKLKGNIILNSSLDLRFLLYPTVFDGENGASITVKTNRGILPSLFGNITFKNISFNWILDSLTYAAGDNVNLDTSGSPSLTSSNGLIYVFNDSDDLKNITIDNCVFTGTFPQSQRPPYIAFIANTFNARFNNIKITNNQFNDPFGLNNQCAIAIVSLGTSNISSNLTDSGLSNSVIDNNIANNNQSIIVSTLANNTLNRTAFFCSNVNISRNRVGAIGYLISSYFESSLVSVYKFDSSGLNIFNNTTTYIGTLDSTGKILDDHFYSINNVGSGDVIIKDNFTSLIFCNFYPCYNTGNTEYGESLLISGNKLRFPTNFSSLITAYGYPDSSTAISVVGWVNRPGGSTTLQTDARIVQILDNNIIYTVNSVSNTVLSYDRGINVESTGAIIRGNVIRNFHLYGINFDNNIDRNKPVKVDIVGNQLYNIITTATHYIGMSDNGGNSTYFTCVNNFFDTTSTNGLPEYMIGRGNINPTNFIIKDNTNQTDSFAIRAIDFGKIVYDGGGVNYEPLFNPSPFIGPDSIAYYPTGSLSSPGNFSQLTVKMNLNSSGFTWFLPISSIKQNVKFKSAKIYYTQIENASVTNQLFLRLRDARYFSGLIPTGGPDITISIVSTNITGNASGFIELSLSTLYQMTDSLSLEVIFEPGGGVGDRTLYLEPLLYTFIY